MSNNNKRISIARAIMYKELAKRNAERELECKRRGLWVLWQQQTRYKTLWHFLRASNERLIELCDECMTVLLDKCIDYMNKIAHFKQCYWKKPCQENKACIEQYSDFYFSCMCVYNEINEIANKLTGGNQNENQN